jgi:hypothetical protein
MTPSRSRLQYLLPKINIMTSCLSRIHHQLVPFFVSNPHHYALPNASALIRGTALLPNDNVLPTADASTECFEENLLPIGVLLPNLAHMSVSSLYKFLVLTYGDGSGGADAWTVELRAIRDLDHQVRLVGNVKTNAPSDVVVDERVRRAGIHKSSQLNAIISYT